MKTWVAEPVYFHCATCLDEGRPGGRHEVILFENRLIINCPDCNKPVWMGDAPPEMLKRASRGCDHGCNKEKNRDH